MKLFLTVPNSSRLSTFFVCCYWVGAHSSDWGVSTVAGTQLSAAGTKARLLASNFLSAKLCFVPVPNSQCVSCKDKQKLLFVNDSVTVNERTGLL